MTTLQTTKYQEFKAWLAERDITIKDIALRLGMTRSACSNLLHQETIPVSRHQSLLALGIPAALLPLPHVKKIGRPIKTPRFPADEKTA